MLTLKNNIFYDGFWQSYKYFENIRDELLKRFVLNYEMNQYYNTILTDICSSDSVSLHVRRGDYISNPDANTFHGICDLDYYKTAIKEVTFLHKNLKFFIFSDDISWVKSNLTFLPSNHEFIESENTDSHAEMFLMSKCRINIIANSSFSWWAAWLNTNINKMVFFPAVWFADKEYNKKTHDLFPSNWIKIY